MEPRPDRRVWRPLASEHFARTLPCLFCREPHSQMERRTRPQDPKKNLETSGLRASCCTPSGIAKCVIFFLRCCGAGECSAGWCGVDEASELSADEPSE